MPLILTHIPFFQVPFPRGLKRLHLEKCSFVEYGTDRKLNTEEEVICPITKHFEGDISISCTTTKRTLADNVNFLHRLRNHHRIRLRL